MKKDLTLHNFRILDTQTVKELDATLIEMRHEKTGARLVWLDRASDNKTFGIAFRTTPENDTGVFHILEHSVLCGSRNFPVKEPFVELMKSSMQTFLNAMTYPDKTFYPVSSRNEKDFINLMRVYLDAVFFPAIYEKPEIFWQEGWHYELREGEPISYKGVVFNEMKGAFASPHTVLQKEINRLMFPDTCYRFVSGGDPGAIPNLSYDQFIDSHKRFYHPSNAWIFLDGSLNPDTVLAILDEEYLGHFDYREMDTSIAFQAPVTGSSTAYYDISPAEELQDKSYAAWAYGLGDYTCRRDVMAMNILSDLLCGSNHAPLTKTILTAGFAEDISMGVLSGQQQNMLLITAEHIRDGKTEELQSLIQTTVQQLLHEGLDHDHIRATLANLELQYRERDYGRMPQGLGFANEVLNSWLYGGDPAANLSMEPLFEELNRLVDTGWYEELLEKTLLHNDHFCQVLLLPSHTEGEKRQQDEAARIARAEAAWSQTEKEARWKQQAQLDAWQTSTDKPEDIARLPRLELSDISEKPEEILTVLEEMSGITLLRHELAAGGISYWTLYFDISDLDEASLSDAAFLCQVLSNADTADTPALDLQKNISLYMGNLNFSIQSFSRNNEPDICRTCFCASFSSLEHKLPQAIDLLLEILNRTDFSNDDVLQKLVLQCRLQLEQSVIGAGHSFAMKRVMAGVSAEGVAQECSSGYHYLQAIKAMEKNISGLGDRLVNLCKTIISTGRLTLSITGAQTELPISRLLEGIPTAAKQTPVCALKAWGIKKEGILIPADISFAVQGGLLPSSGKMQTAAQIASLAYLWNAVRVQGGAYGAGMNTVSRGCGIFYSYRDPNAARSLACYQQTADFIRQFASCDPDLTGFIIGTISAMEPLLLPESQGKLADSWYFKETSYEDRCTYRKEILSASTADLLKLADDIQRMIEQGGTCVVGPKTHLEACGITSVHTL